MNGTLGRDKIWNDQIWNDIDKAVREEVGRIRIAQKVFPTTVVNNVLPVSRSRTVPFGVGALGPVFPALDEFQPFFEISTEFQLTQAQVEGEESGRLAASFARLAASVLADAEDCVLFLGAQGIGLLPAGVNVTNQPPAGIPPQYATIPPGFVAEANNYPPPILVPAPVPPAPIGDIMAAVANGIAALNLLNRVQPGPYALFLSPIHYAGVFSPAAPGLLQTPGDAIRDVVTGGIYMVRRLAVANLGALVLNPPLANPNIGILTSLGGEPAKIVLGTDAITAFTQIDAQGNYHFRVFERMQLVVRDGSAFQLLAF
ncbi:MAG: hypothetical protein JO232_05535 [Verrucomicrobia bacterium]|nr:hypothetical protein [Verrucomicrobiota bacterium]